MPFTELQFFRFYNKKPLAEDSIVNIVVSISYGSNK